MEVEAVKFYRIIVVIDLIWVLVVRGPRGMWLVNSGFIERFVIWTESRFGVVVDYLSVDNFEVWNYRIIIWDANLRASK